MKKIIIIFLSLLLNFSAQANERDLLDFGTWLTKNNLNSVTKINDYNNRSEIPEDVKPNFDTLLFYYWKYTNRNWNNNPKYTDIKASENPYKFESNLREDAYVKKQMQKTALLSYLLLKMEKLL